MHLVSFCYLELFIKIACAPSEDSDHTSNPHNLIRVLAVRLKTLWVFWEHAAQTDLGLRWAHMQYCTKCCAPVYMIKRPRVWKTTALISCAVVLLSLDLRSPWKFPKTLNSPMEGGESNDSQLLFNGYRRLHLVQSFIFFCRVHLRLKWSIFFCFWKPKQNVSMQFGRCHTNVSQTHVWMNLVKPDILQ